MGLYSIDFRTGCDFYLREQGWTHSKSEILVEMGRRIEEWWIRRGKQFWTEDTKSTES